MVYRVHQAEYGIHILVAASQEYVNTYSTRRPMVLRSERGSGDPKGEAYKHMDISKYRHTYVYMYTYTYIAKRWPQFGTVP